MALRLGETVSRVAQKAVDTIKDGITSDTGKSTPTTKARELTKDGVDSARPKAPDAVDPTKNAESGTQNKLAEMPREEAAKLRQEAKVGMLKAEFGGVNGAVASGTTDGSALNVGVSAVGGMLKSAGREIKEAASSLTGTVADGVASLGQKAAALGAQMESAPHVVSQDLPGLTDKIRTMGQKIVSTAEKIGEMAVEPAPLQGSPSMKEKVKEGLDKIAEVAGEPSPLLGDRGTMDRIKDGGRTLINMAKDVGEWAETRASPSRQVDKLKPGEKFTTTIGAGGNLPIPGVKDGFVKVGEKGTLEVECKEFVDPDTKEKKKQYVVSLEGEAAGGLAASASRQKDALNAAVTASAAGRIEYTFDNPEDAKRGLDALATQLAKDSQCHLSANDWRKDPALAKEQEFLNRHTSAVELRGAAASAISAEFGEKGVQRSIRGAQKGEVAVRVEYKDGEPSKLVLRQQYQIEGQAGLNAAFIQKGYGAKMNMGTVTTKGTMTVEERFDVPKGMSVDTLTHPDKLRPAVKEMARSCTAKINVSMEANGAAMGDGGGVRAEFEVSGQPSRILTDQNLTDLATGNHSKALRRMGRNVSVTASVKAYDQLGFAFNPEVGLGPYGSVAAEYSAVRQRTRWAPDPYRGNAMDAVDYLDRNLADGQPYLDQMEREARGEAIRPD